MRSKLIDNLMLILSLVSVAACNSEDDDSNGTAGATASGGRSGSTAGGSAGRSSGGRSGSNAGGSSGEDEGGGTSGGTGEEAGAGGEGGTSGGSGGVGNAGRGGAGGTAGTAGKAGSGGTGGSGGSAGKAGSGGSSGTAGGGGSAGTAGGGGTGGKAGAGGTSAGGGAGTGGQGGGIAFAMLDNAEVVKVLATLNQGEVSAAQVAQPAAQRTSVKNFAAMMITEHTNASAQTLALVSTKHIAPQPSAVSEHLEQETATLLATLSQTPQADFDRVYIQSQIDAHQEALTLIDVRLLPDSTDPDLKALTTNIRVSVSAHLQAAQTILAGF